MRQTKHILLATDLTERSQRALMRALQLKRATAAGLTLMHVAEPGSTEELTQSRRAAATATMEALLSPASPGKLRRVDIRVRVGEVVTAIVAEAESRSADLIVLGEPGKPRLWEFFAGTTAVRIIRHSQCPVLLAKTQSDQPYQRVLVAFDPSAAARRALRTALALAPRAEFRLVHARQSHGAGQDRRESERTQVLLNNAAERVVRQSLYPHARLAIDAVDGAPVPAITNGLAALGADLLAMGTHGRGGLQTAFFGSVAQELLATRSSDVLVTPP
jgi:nucleotide-binding universal stress UspA family protein